MNISELWEKVRAFQYPIAYTCLTPDTFFPVVIYLSQKRPPMAYVVSCTKLDIVRLMRQQFTTLQVTNHLLELEQKSTFNCGQAAVTPDIWP